MSDSQHVSGVTEERCGLRLLVTDGLNSVIDIGELVDLLEGDQLLFALLGELHSVKEVKVLGDLHLFCGDAIEFGVGELNLHGVVHVKPMQKEKVRLFVVN